MVNQIDKKRVADSFSRAAETYDQVADLQRQVGHQLLQLLPETKSDTVLDLGCGTGYFSERLQQQCTDSSLINLDLALGMLRFAREQRQLSGAHWLCADAESLPLADNSVDLIFSSLAIQWCGNVSQLFSEIARVLRPGGRFVFSTLGPETLFELREAWQSADGYVHVNEFMPRSQLLAGLDSQLKLSRFEEEYTVLKYLQLNELTDELKKLGAHNMNQGQKTGLTGRQAVRKFKHSYERQRGEDGMLPATYQVFYGVVEKVGH